MKVAKAPSDEFALTNCVAVAPTEFSAAVKYISVRPDASAVFHFMLRYGCVVARAAARAPRWPDPPTLQSVRKDVAGPGGLQRCSAQMGSPVARPGDTRDAA